MEIIVEIAKTSELRNLRALSRIPLKLVCFDRSLQAQEDLWDFGTVRHVHARPGGPATLRRAQAQQAQQQYRQQSQPPQHHPSHGSSVRSHDYARASPSTSSQPLQPNPPFDTVRRAPPSSAASFSSSNPSAHSEYDAFSSAAPSTVDADERARDALDRERDRLEKLRLQQVQEEEDRYADDRSTTPRRGDVASRGREDSNESQEDEEEAEGNILDTVVLPVLDSVSLVFCRV